MNGYDAQDMATQGADGFRNGYQAGYADARTAAAPGIDLVSDILTDLSCVGNSWVVEATGAAADAQNQCAMQIMEAIERWSNRLNLGDTSPKGGSDSSDAPWRPISELPISDDLFWFARGDTIDGPRVPQAGGYDADEWNWFAPAEAPGFTPEMDAERDQQHREMQATSAEVGS